MELDLGSGTRSGDSTSAHYQSQSRQCFPVASLRHRVVVTSVWLARNCGCPVTGNYRRKLPALVVSDTANASVCHLVLFVSQSVGTVEFTAPGQSPLEESARVWVKPLANSQKITYPQCVRAY